MNALLWKVRRRLFGPGIARAVAGAGAPRHALLMYTVGAFRDSAARATHQNIFQQRELARAIAGLGYEVDVVDYDERRAGLLRHEYDLVVDLHPVEHPIYEGRLRPGAKQIAYMTGNNPEFSNAAEQARLADLEQRRGVRLAPRRWCEPFPRRQLEAFDAFWYFGNDASLATYSAYHLPPAYRLFNNGYDDVLPTEPARRDPRRFMFLGGFGQVHKGLDLLLDVFAGEPDLELVVCSSFRAERDFASAYQRELSAVPNIRAVGFADVKSAAFRELQAGCGAMILPSCSEVQSSNVTVAMSFGMPCVVGPACGFDEPGIRVLPDCSIETLRDVVRDLAAQTPQQVAERCASSLALMRCAYLPAHYAAAVRAALVGTLGVPAGEQARHPGGG